MTLCCLSLILFWWLVVYIRGTSSMFLMAFSCCFSSPCGAAAMWRRNLFLFESADCHQQRTTGKTHSIHPLANTGDMMFLSGWIPRAMAKGENEHLDWASITFMGFCWIASLEHYNRFWFMSWPWLVPLQNLNFILAVAEVDLSVSFFWDERRGCQNTLWPSMAIPLEVHCLPGCLHLQNMSVTVICKSTKALEKALGRTAGSVALSVPSRQPNLVLSALLSLAVMDIWPRVPFPPSFGGPLDAVVV